MGVRVEDLVLVTDHGHEILNHFSKEQTMIVGDRLYTDILCGYRTGVETALVLTGETTRQEAEACEYGPDYLFSSIGQLAEAWRDA